MCNNFIFHKMLSAVPKIRQVLFFFFLNLIHDLLVIRGHA